MSALSEPEVTILRSFLFNAIHDAQQHLGPAPRPSNNGDVLVYLVHQLVNAANPAFLSPQHQSALFGTPTDLQLFFEAHPDLSDVGRAQVYALNANVRVMLIVIFRKESLLRPGASVFSPHTHLRHAQVFYQFAGDLFEHRRRHSTSNATLAEIHFKLAKAFDWYMKLLDRLRVDYLHLIEHLSPGTMFHLEREVQRGFDRAQDQQTMDAYLDAMIEHQREPSEEKAHRMQQAKQAAQQRGLVY